MFTARNPEGYRNSLPGVHQKTIAHGDKTLMVEFHFVKDSLLPMHAHPHEQTGYLVSGHLRLRIGGESHDVRPGDSWCVPGGVEHGADALEDTVALEVFSPVREDYLP